MLESQRVNRTSSFSTGITRPPLFRARIPANGRPAALRLSEIKAAAGWPSCPVAFQALAAGHSKRRELGTGILPCADVSLVSSGAGSSPEWLEHSAWLSRSKFQDKVPSSPPSQKTKKKCVRDTAAATLRPCCGRGGGWKATAHRHSPPVVVETRLWLGQDWKIADAHRPTALGYIISTRLPPFGISFFSFLP